MNLKEKLAYVANHIDSIARHDSEEVDVVHGFLDRVIKYAEDAKATVLARARMPAKLGIATDENGIRQKIANLEAAIASTTDENAKLVMQDTLRTLGAMLPPVTGTLKVGPMGADLNAAS